MQNWPLLGSDEKRRARICNGVPGLLRVGTTRSADVSGCRKQRMAPYHTAHGALIQLNDVHLSVALLEDVCGVMRLLLLC